MRRVLRVGVAIAGALGLGGALLLVEAHLEIRGIEPALPTAREVMAFEADPEGPVRIAYLNSASQAMPGGREGVYPSFVLEWGDGRLFLIDVGMDRPGARAFGRPLEWLVGAEPAVAHGSAAEQLATAAPRVAGVAFTHLHTDHTGGMRELCEAAAGDIEVFQAHWQQERANFGTAPGAADLEDAGCVDSVRLEGGPLEAIPGFPGLYAVAAAGHTPGSTLYLARVGDRSWILAGDVSNEKANLLANVAKPLAYSVLIVPEDRARLEVLRRWLAALDADPAIEVIVSHDGDALRASGLLPWSGAPEPALRTP